ncbi:hypothetical protein [Pseudomonas kurunegalensis]|uniref:hypothetical protein n=1 Tax=Pseudomonas kurunegalensis TaxID=485880 RepID=UPI0025710A64|nr:hypothetical protein [Pseudomonas kurunegalensis]WJD60747.1 hypothetical protein QQ992_17585 [Pseudomonas kurunegalensis]
MNSFAFRAECIGDVCEFLKALGEKFSIDRCLLSQDTIFPDVEVVVKVRALISDLKEVAFQIEDCHVIAESLKAQDITEYERVYWEHARFLLNEGRRPAVLPLALLI